jgi:hypothetical protein
MKHLNEQSKVQADPQSAHSTWSTRLALGIPTGAPGKQPKQSPPDLGFRSRSIDLCV